MKSEFHVKANRGFVVRGPLLSLQLVLDELQRFVAARPDLDLVYQTISADRIFISTKDDSRSGVR